MVWPATTGRPTGPGYPVYLVRIIRTIRFGICGIGPSRTGVTPFGTAHRRSFGAAFYFSGLFYAAGFGYSLYLLRGLGRTNIRFAVGGVLRRILVLWGNIGFGRFLLIFFKS